MNLAGVAEKARWKTLAIVQAHACFVSRNQIFTQIDYHEERRTKQGMQMTVYGFWKAIFNEGLCLNTT